MEEVLKLAGPPPVGGDVLLLVRSWASGRIFRNPVHVLNETLADRGRAAYDYLLGEIFRVLRKRLGVEAGIAVHFVIHGGHGWMIRPCAAIRAGEDTIQQEGNMHIHPLPREGASEAKGN